MKGAKSRLKFYGDTTKLIRNSGDVMIKVQ